MPTITYVNANITQNTVFDPTLTAGSTVFVSANSTLVSTSGSSMWSFGFDNVSYIINGEIFGSWDSYADNVRLTIGATGTHNEAWFMQMNALDIWNHGTIQSRTNLAISKYGFGEAGWSEDMTIYNTGSILGGPNDIYSGSGVIDAQEGTNKIVNFGFIGGSDLAIRVHTGGEARVENYGTIDGDVLFEGTQVDRVTNSGDIFGDVSMGDGDDVYRAIDDGAVDGVIRGEGGSDLIRGGSGDDEIEGGNQKDTLRGRDGDDTISGGNQNDDIRGGHGDDVINGDNGYDSLRGGSGDDIMSGGYGNDTIDGGRGNDTMTGGVGADTFVLIRNNDDDEITDFKDGTDMIDISAFGLLAADFATDVAPGLSATAGGSTMLDLSALGGSGTVLIGGVAVTDVTVADFIF